MRTEEQVTRVAQFFDLSRTKSSFLFAWRFEIKDQDQLCAIASNLQHIKDDHCAELSQSLKRHAFPFDTAHSLHF